MGDSLQVKVMMEKGRRGTLLIVLAFTWAFNSCKNYESSQFLRNMSFSKEFLVLHMTAF